MNTPALFLLASAFFGRLVLALPGPGDSRLANATSRLDKIKNMYAFEGFVYALDNCPSYNDMVSDFTRMHSKGARSVITFDLCGDGTDAAYYGDAIRAAGTAGINMIPLVWTLLDNGQSFDDLDVRRINAVTQAVISNPDPVLAVAMGDEPLYDWDFGSPENLATYIRKMKSDFANAGHPDIPVSISDMAYGWQSAGDISNVADAVDFFMINNFPYFAWDAQGGGSETSWKDFTGDISYFESIANGKPLLVTQTGWPSNEDEFTPNSNSIVVNLGSEEGYWNLLDNHCEDFFKAKNIGWMWRSWDESIAGWGVTSNVNLGYAAFAGNSTSPAGEANGPVTFFGGIPYAQPPLGNLRFRAPAPLVETVPDKGSVPITDARDWGPFCIQQPAQVGIGSEDCLKLNVWKPTDAKEGDKLPVIVYIHGGGFFAGNPQGFPLYDWVNQSNPNIVGVSIAYRLNLLGFLAGTSVRRDGDLNAGLLDQRAALEWIQRHIARFGGDPDQVTIDGESAGGASIVMQIVAFGGSKPVPFKRGIAQSIGYGPTPTADQAETVFQNVTEVVGCPSSGPQAMGCLRNASPGAIVAAINSIPAGMLAPVVDGPSGILPELPNTLITSGRFSSVDFMGGHCTTEGRTFVGGPPQDFVTDADVARLVFKRWGTHISDDLIQKALALYPAPGTPGSPFATQYDRAWTMAQEIIFGCMDWFLADRLQQKGVKNVFTFRFNSPNPVLLAETPYEGVMHTSDLFYLFDGSTSAPNAGFTFTAFNSTEDALSRESIAFWTSFVSSGDPSTSRELISPGWQPFASGGRMVLSQPSSTDSMTSASSMEVTPPDEIERCKFWMSLNATAQTEL
ncbi:hypothetical protein ACEPAH_2466 [Sanghuangporus vaninii]